MGGKYEGSFDRLLEDMRRNRQHVKLLPPTLPIVDYPDLIFTSQREYPQPKTDAAMAMVLALSESLKKIRGDNDIMVSLSYDEMRPKKDWRKFKFLRD